MFQKPYLIDDMYYEGKYIEGSEIIKALLAFLSTIIIIFAFTQQALGSVSGDLDGDKIVSQEELDAAENSFKQGNISSHDIELIRHIHEAYPRRVTDSLGNEVTIYSPVNKIIAINSNAVELLRSIRSADKIIAVDDSVKSDRTFYPEMSGLQSIGTNRAPDSEKILELQPDLVITSATWDRTYGDELQKTLSSTDKNITVIRLDCYRLETYENETGKLAYLLEKENESKEFMAFFNKCLKGVTDKTSQIPQDKRPRVYLGYGDFPTYGAYGNSAGAASRLEMAGGYNIFGDEIEKDYADVDPEKIVAKNPDIILRQVKEGGYDTSDTSKMKALWEKTMNVTGWGNLNAIKDKKVYMMSSKLQNTRYFIGLLYTAKIVSPELFKDMDPQALHQEYLTKFQNLSIDLEKQGVFTYPSY
jgi:iron complex transport system substrate-binding protein